MPAPPPGIADAYDAASKQLADQLSQVDSTDSKLGVSIGLLAVGIGFLSAVAAPMWVRFVIGTFLLVGLGSAAMGFLTGRGDYLNAPSPSAVRDLASLAPEQAKMVLIENVVAAFESNQPHLHRKERHLRITVIALGVNLIFAVVVRVFGLL